MKWNNNKTAKYESYDTPNGNDVCKTCGENEFVFCKSCNCFECSSILCGAVFNNGM